MRPITDTMHHIGGGFFISAASDKMAELVQKVNESGKSGKIEKIKADTGVPLYFGNP